MPTQNLINSNKPIEVAKGGTGLSSWPNNNSILLGGTTSTDNLQNATSVGTFAQFLTSNGASAKPSFQSVGWSLIQSQSVSGTTADVQFTTGLSGYSIYLVQYSRILKSSPNTYLYAQISTDGGSTWINSGYSSQCLWNNYNSINLTNTNTTTGMIVNMPNNNAQLTQGQIYIFGLGVNRTVQFSAHTCGSAAQMGRAVGGYSVATCNAIRFLMNTGSLTQGRIAIYGLAL